jgi:hypothetical protein
MSAACSRSAYHQKATGLQTSRLVRVAPRADIAAVAFSKTRSLTAIAVRPPGACRCWLGPAFNADVRHKKFEVAWLDRPRPAAHRACRLVSGVWRVGRQYLPTENLRLGEISGPHGARRLTSRERVAN